MSQVEKFIIKMSVNNEGKKIFWKEHASSPEDISNHSVKEDGDIVNKAIESGIDIPIGKQNAISMELLIEKIITTLTYSI